MNSLWIDKKYINLIAAQLPRFAWKSADMANFRCILCGDSQQNSFKARAYLYPVKASGYMMKCHNCSRALPFAALLKRVSRPLFDEYIMEKFRSGRERVDAPRVRPEISVPVSRVFSYPHVEQLSSSSLSDVNVPVRTYVQQRGLPATALQRLYATSHAHTWLQSLVGTAKTAQVRDDVPYLVIPLRHPDRSWYGAQLRRLDQKTYLTFLWEPNTTRIFGLDVHRPSEITYCVEGPLDALCIPNALAMCGSDLLTGVAHLQSTHYILPRLVLVWDNEPRAKAITQHMSHAISQGYAVVIWPRALPKDANDMYAAGYDVPRILADRTFTGLRAELEFSQWKQS